VFLAITEKEMEVFGITLPERCVLTGHANDNSIVMCIQNKKYGGITQRVIDLSILEKTQSEFISQVFLKNEFDTKTTSENGFVDFQKA
jgi:hypothetical protein